MELNTVLCKKHGPISLRGINIGEIICCSYSTEKYITIDNVDPLIEYPVKGLLI